MKASKEYRDAPNPTPRTVTRLMWALSDERGRIDKYIDGGAFKLYDKRPDGYFRAGCMGGGIFKPRRVRVTIEAI